MDQAVQHVQRILAVRRRRTDFFKSGLFDEQVWDLMLVLFIATHDNIGMSRLELLETIPASASVLDRWISVLQGETMIDEDSFERDALKLSADAQHKMYELLSTTVDL